MTVPYLGGAQPPKRPRTMQEIADSVRVANTVPGSSGRSMEEIAASVLGPQQPMSWGEIGTGAARAFGGGLLFQYEDEVEGGVRSALGGSDYRTERDKVRAEQQLFKDRYPATAITGEIAGAVVPTLGAIALSGGTASPAVVPQLGARMARAAGGGMLSGAVTGAGAAPEMKDIPRDAGIGAVAGGVVGGSLPAAGAGVRRLGNKVMDIAEAPIRAAAENVPDRPLSTTVGVMADSLAGRGFGAGARAFARDAKDYGVGSTIAKRIGVPALEQRAAGRAEQKLMQALIDDGFTPDQAAARIEQMMARGAPAAVADAADENLLELTNVPFLIPGEGRKTVSQYFRERVLGASGRLAEGVERSSGARMGNVKKMVTEIADRRKPPAKQLYQEAYAHGPVQLDEDVTDIVLTSDARKAWFEGLRRSRLESFTDIDKQPLPALYRVARDESGGEVIELMRAPTVRDIDIIKRGFDVSIKAALAKDDKDLARILNGARVKMLNLVDPQVPKYEQARAFWAGEQGLMDALESGKKFLRGGDDEYQLVLESMTPDEREMYRIGAANSIAEALRRREGRAVAVNILTDPTAQRRLQQLYPDEASWQLMADIVDDEVKLAGPFARMSRQSQTAQNLLNVMDFAGDFRPGDIVPDPKAMGIKALFGLANAGQQRAKQSSAAQLARLLTQQGPEATAYLRSLQPKVAGQTQAAQAAARAQGRAGGLIGGRLPRGY